MANGIPIMLSSKKLFEFFALCVALVLVQTAGLNYIYDREPRISGENHAMELQQMIYFLIAGFVYFWKVFGLPQATGKYFGCGMGFLLLGVATREAEIDSWFVDEGLGNGVELVWRSVLCLTIGVWAVKHFKTMLELLRAPRQLLDWMVLPLVAFLGALFVASLMIDRKWVLIGHPHRLFHEELLESHAAMLLVLNAWVFLPQNSSRKPESVTQNLREEF